MPSGRCKAIDFGTSHNVLYAEAAGVEFLGEDAVHKGNYKESLQLAARETAIAEKLHSRERRAWAHYYAGHAYELLGQSERATEELRAGIALAEAIGEKRVLSLLNASLAITLASLGQYDKALENATANLDRATSISLLYSHFEALRSLAYVHYRRGLSGTYEGELDEAERVCLRAESLIEPTESRVSRLWLGPLYMEVLLAQKKYDEAREKLIVYQELVASCQSPRFTAEASRLAELVAAKSH